VSGAGDGGAGAAAGGGPAASDGASAGGGPAAGDGATAVAHVGLTVSDLDLALRFWERLLGRRARARTVLRRPYVGRLVGIPGVEIEAAFVALGGGVELELLCYRGAPPAPLPPASGAPGHAHLCLAVADVERTAARAVVHGAVPVGGGPVAIDAGPNAGTRAVYLRVPPDAHTLELFERGR